MRKLVFTVAAMLLWSLGAQADPLTFYSNQAAWEAAVANDSVGTYSGTITRTDYLATYDYSAFDGIHTVNTFTSVDASNGSFQPSFFANFSIAGDLIDGCGSPCTVVGYAGGGEVVPGAVVDFSTPIAGFGADFGFYDESRFTINGELIPYVTSGFLGMTGNTSELVFAGDCAICDDFAADKLVLTGVRIAVPEPPAFYIPDCSCAVAVGLRAQKPHSSVG